MITYIVDNIFESPAQVLVNTVNTVGVMGKGIAKEFKKRYPEMFKEYQKLCESNDIAIGKLWLYKTREKWVLNFPTKTTWRQPSKVEYIEEGLKAFVNEYAQRGIISIAFPPLGCGNGDLDWEKQVKPLMEKYLGKLPIDVFVYFYKKEDTVLEHQQQQQMAEWLQKEPESLSFHEVWENFCILLPEKSITFNYPNGKTFRFDLGDYENDAVLTLTSEIKTLIYKEALLDFWHLLRTYGFMTAKIVPPSLFDCYEEIIQLFLKLPYCKKVQVTTEYTVLRTSHAIGIQLLGKQLNSPLEGQLNLLDL